MMGLDTKSLAIGAVAGYLLGHMVVGFVRAKMGK